MKDQEKIALLKSIIASLDGEKFDHEQKKSVDPWDLGYASGLRHAMKLIDNHYLQPAEKE